MNWALGQTYANTEATRQDMAGIKVDLAHREASAHADMVALKTAFDLQVSDLRHNLSATESSIRHDMRKGFDAVERRFTGVDERFDAVNQRFDAVNQRFDAVNQRFDGLEAKVDMILAEMRGGK
jgi:tetrahydromethanopterin S-methyltransferase subunit G